MQSNLRGVGTPPPFVYWVLHVKTYPHLTLFFSPLLKGALKGELHKYEVLLTPHLVGFSLIRIYYEN